MSILKVAFRILVASLLPLAMHSSVYADSAAAPPVLSTSSSSQSLGIGQRWYNYTGSRGLFGYYYNTSSRAIQVNVIIGIQSRGGSATFYVDGVSVGGAYNGSSTDWPTTFNHVIPPGSWYMVQGYGGRTGVSSWSEMW